MRLDRSIIANPVSPSADEYGRYCPTYTIQPKMIENDSQWKNNKYSRWIWNDCNSMIDEKKKLQLQAATSSTAAKKNSTTWTKNSDTGLVSESENRIQKTKFREETRTLKFRFIKNCMTHYYNSWCESYSMTVFSSLSLFTLINVQFLALIHQ